jgi:DNA-binding transcriptional regulator YiaG
MIRKIYVHAWTICKEMSENFSDRIKAARQRLGLTQSQAARKWGFPKQTINAWEAGIRHPAGLYLKKLERILKHSETPK